MVSLIRNILAVIVGAFACMMLNGLIIGVSPRFVPPPAGVDPAKLESIQANIHLYQPQHFLMPFLAHATGSFVGGLFAALIAARHKMIFALVIGGLHLLGGIAAVAMIGGPLWFIVLDLGIAYLPMAWLGGILAGANRKSATCDLSVVAASGNRR